MRVTEIIIDVGVRDRRKLGWELMWGFGGERRDLSRMRCEP